MIRTKKLRLIPWNLADFCPRLSGNPLKIFFPYQKLFTLHANPAGHKLLTQGPGEVPD